MIGKSKTFVLGAGTSYGYGYPLGNQLKEQIIKLVEQRNFLIPLKQSELGSSYYTQGTYYINDLTNAYDSTFDFDRCNTLTEYTSIKASSNTYTYHKHKESGSYDRSIKDHILVNVPLKNIIPFQKISEELKNNHYNSIDELVNERPELADHGKILINFLIREKECIDLSSRRNYHGDHKKIVSNKYSETYDKHYSIVNEWYSYLFNDLASNCKNFEDILNKDIKIITFNYDCSLEYFFIKRFNSPHNKFYADKDKLFNFISNKIYHVYGQVIPIKKSENIEGILNTYGDFYLYTMERSKNIQPESLNDCAAMKKHQLLWDSIQTYKNINTMRYDKNEPQKKDLTKIIKEAKEINILGYSFDKNNNTFIGLDNISSDCKLNYLNYDNQQWLRNKFKKLYSDKYHYKVFESTKSSVSEAYNDICYD